MDVIIEYSCWLTDFTVLSSSSGGTFTDITTLGQNITGSAVMTRFVHAWIERLFAIFPSVLRWAYALVLQVDALVSLIIKTNNKYSSTDFIADHKYLVFVALVVVQVIRVELLSHVVVVVQDSALAALAFDDVELGVSVFLLPLATLAAASFGSGAVATLAGHVLLEDGLTGRAVQAGEICTAVVPAVFYAVRLDDVFVEAQVEVDRRSVNAHLADTPEEAVGCADVVEHPAKSSYSS